MAVRIGDYAAFKAALRLRESSNNYAAVNSLGYLGAYQFGEAALIDLGFVNRDGNIYDNVFNAGWTGRAGIDTRAEFLASPAAQEAAIDDWTELLWRYLRAVDADDYLGRTIAGVTITASALIAGAHLAGAGGVIRWLESGGALDPTDAFGTSLGGWMEDFAGYEMDFATGDSWVNQILGTAAGEVLTGTDGDDQIIARGGDDDISGGDGNDEIFGGAGADIARGNEGHDWISGNGGDDEVRGGAGDDNVAGAGGDDMVYGGTGDDDLGGGAGNDLLDGGEGNDTLGGGPGNDTVLGGDGDDFVAGGPGDDVLDGGTGNDRLVGGPGDDVLTGGSGADVFVIWPGWDEDVVTDFTPGTDKVDLTNLPAIEDWDDLMADHAAQDGADVVISAGDNALVLEDVLIDALVPDDFIF